MTPNEKANELLNKYYIELHCHKGYYDLETSRVCALITVDEILNTNTDTSIYGGSFSKYWQEVKTELEKL